MTCFSESATVKQNTSLEFPAFVAVIYSGFMLTLLFALIFGVCIHLLS